METWIKRTWTQGAMILPLHQPDSKRDSSVKGDLKPECYWKGSGILCKWNHNIWRRKWWGKGNVPMLNYTSRHESIWDVEAWLHAFLTLALDLSASWLKHFTPGEITPPPHVPFGSGNWVCSGAGLDALEWEKYLDSGGNGTTIPVMYVA
jgi:hypothetical protein